MSRPKGGVQVTVQLLTKLLPVSTPFKQHFLDIKASLLLNGRQETEAGHREMRTEKGKCSDGLRWGCARPGRRIISNPPPGLVIISAPESDS